MRMDEIKQLVKKEPFRPFTLFVTDGRSFEIRHPESVILSASSVEIAISGQPLPNLIHEKRSVVSLLHVTGYDQMQPAPSVGAN